MDQESLRLGVLQTSPDDAAQVAACDTVPIGDLARGWLHAQMTRRLKARQPDGREDPKTTAFKSLLATEIALADDWADLKARLGGQGCALRAEGNTLAVYRHRCGTRVCKLDDLGISYASLKHRFECDMAGYSGSSPTLGVISSPPNQHRVPCQGDPIFEVIDFDA